MNRSLPPFGLLSRVPRRLAGWAMLLALWLQIATSGTMPVPPATGDGADGGLGRVVVCTAAGMVVLADADDGGTPAQTAAPLCVFCLPLMHAGLDVVPVFLPLPSETSIASPSRRGTPGPILAVRVFGPGPRAPPIA